MDFCSLNGGRWTVEGEVNTIKETVAVKGNFTISGMQKNYHNQLLTQIQMLIIITMMYKDSRNIKEGV